MKYLSLSPSKGTGEDTLEVEVEGDFIFKSKMLEFILFGDKVGKYVAAVAILLIEVEVVVVEEYFLVEQEE